jgi:hypothetical protein
MHGSASVFLEAYVGRRCAPSPRKRYIYREGEGATLTITTDGSVAAIAGVFTGLRDAGIEPAEFSQKAATLDDAFLKIVGSSREEA